MNPQDVFDTVARHLFTQGTRAGCEVRNEYGEVHDFECLYRAPDGRSCAVGCLIPDAAYRPSMEGSSACTLTVMFSDVLPPWMAASSELLLDLQALHDAEVNWRDDTAMKFALGLLADRFALDKSVLDSLSFNREPVEA